MTTEDLFPKCLPVILQMEGGYCNHPSDPGGETNYGIAKRAYPDVDVKTLTKAQAGDIYRRDYWDKAGCADLAWPLALVHFDAAVNHGRQRAARFLAGAATGEAYLSARAAFYERLIVRRPASSVFRKGWMNRLKHIARAGGITWTPDA